MKIREKRKAGKILGREGISRVIIRLAKDIAQGSCKNAMNKAGRISVLVEAASYDECYSERIEDGKNDECAALLDLIKSKEIKGWKTIESFPRNGEKFVGFHIELREQVTIKFIKGEGANSRYDRFHSPSSRAEFDLSAFSHWDNMPDEP